MVERKFVFAERLRGLRADAGITRGDMAEQAGISRAYTYYLESGEKSPTIEVCESLANVFGVNPRWLAGWGGTKTGR